MNKSRREYRAMLEAERAAAMQGLRQGTDKLERIDRALARLRADQFGVCQACGNPIREERLELLPYAELCFHCQQDQERSGRTS